MNKIELSDQKYQTNGNVRDENYKGNLLFPMENLVSFGTYHKSMYFKSTVLLKYMINGVRVPQPQLAQIRNTNNSLHKYFAKLCREVYYVWQGNKDM